MDDNYKNKCDCILPIGDDYRHITQKIRDLCHNCKCGETYDYDAINVLLDNETANNAPAAQTSSIVNSFRHLFSQLKAELSHQLSEDRETEDDDGQSQQKLLLTLLGRNYVDDFLGKQQERKSKSEYFKVCGKIDEMQIQTETKKREEILFHTEKANLTQADSGELNVREPIKLPIRSLDLEFIGTISIYPNSLHVLPRKTDISVQVNHENGSNNDEQIEVVSAAAIPSLLKNNNNNSSITTTESSNITSEMSAGQIEAEKVAWLFAHHGDRATVYNVNKAGMVSNFATRECSAHNMQSATNARARDAKKSPALKPSPKRKNYLQNLVEIVPKTKDNAIVAREVSFPSSFDTAQFFGEFPVNNSLGNSSNKAIIQEDEGESTLDQITPISTTFESN